jgi:hypothetical protein
MFTMTSPKQGNRLQKVRDGRTAWARRHRELAAGFAADLGSNLSAIDRSLVDHAATIALEAEQMKAAQLNDQAVDIEQLVRLTNSLTRLRVELGKRAAAKADDGPSWDEVMAEADRLTEQRLAEQRRLRNEANAPTD